MTSTVVNSGKLANYGTPEAQAYLQKWANKYGAARDNPKK
jgi:hypothetical protein